MKLEETQHMIIEGYSSDIKREWKRLTKHEGIIEYLTTVRYLEKYLPKGGVIADIGSGPGRYSLWLAEHGYDVVAVDPVENNIRSLKARFRGKGLGKKLISAHIGYAQNLDMLENEEFDAVVCLGGPLSHVMKLQDRQNAIKEFTRISKLGAPIFISIMGRLSVFNGTVRMFNEDLDSDYIMKWAETGDYFGGYGFLPYHGFKLNEVEELFGSSISLLAKVGLEGFASYSGAEIIKLKRNKRRWDRYLKIHFSICEDPETIGVSEHYMVVGKKRSNL